MILDQSMVQFQTVKPPEDGKVISISVDGTSRTYDLSLVNFGDNPVPFGDSRSNDSWYYVSLDAIGNDVYFTFSAAAATVDDTAHVSAGGTLAYTPNACPRVISGLPTDKYINRVSHRYLNIKCVSGKTATLTLYISSELLPGATK